VGGNPGTTVGQQRLNVFQYAANIWGGILPSTVTIVVRAQFNPQTCTATSAVLGSAGPVTVHRDFANADFPLTWYHAALANKLAGTDLDIVNPDINATFNSNLNGSPTCLGGTGWYLGLDGNEGTNIELLPVVLHELGHGLGFSTTTSGSTGNLFNLYPHVWDRFLFDTVTGLHWYQMTPAQRQASAIALDKLVWNGPGAFSDAASFLSPRVRVLVNSPGSIAGNYFGNAASFGANVLTSNVTADIELVNDGAGASTSDGCEPIVNNLAGKIALIDRGTCAFVLKAANAQAAGAVAVIIANNVAGEIIPGGTDPSIVIPVIGVTQATGNLIKAELLNGPVNATIGPHPTQLSGTDASGRPLMYTPNPFQGGSSVSHWDVSMTPNTLMEPAINASLSSGVDITTGLFEDIGWFPQVTATTLTLFDAAPAAEGIRLRWQFHDPTDVAVLTVERARQIAGPWQPVATELGREGTLTTAVDGGVEPGITYWYRLSVVDRDGQTQKFGPVEARLERTAQVAFAGAPRPNPAADGATVSFRLPNPEFVRLAVYDVRGARVASLQQGMMAPGEHSVRWNGRVDGGGAAAPGIYLVSLTTSRGTLTQRLSVVR
jgi:hypothetical protein